MIVRTTWLGLLGLAIALAQNPQGPGGPPRRFGAPGGQGRMIGAEMGRPGHVVKNAPFTADILVESTQHLSNGDHIKQSTTSHIARDSEGRTRRDQSLSGLNPVAGNSAPAHNVVFIDDPVAGISYALNPANKTASKAVRPARSGAGPRGGPSPQVAPNRPRPDGPPAGRGRGPANNQDVKTESLGTQNMEGVQVAGTRTTWTIPAGRMGNDQPIQIVTERWYSSDLQLMILEKSNDPRRGETVTRYTNVSRAEPVPTQFQVPADYQVTQTGRGAGAKQ